MPQVSLPRMEHWSWSDEDEEESRRQGWGVVYVDGMGAYCPVEHPIMGYSRLMTKHNIGVMQTQYRHLHQQEAPEIFTTILENAMFGSETALKALTAIVTTNPDYANYKKTLESLTA